MMCPVSLHSLVNSEVLTLDVPLKAYVANYFLSNIYLIHLTKEPEEELVQKVTNEIRG